MSKLVISGGARLQGEIEVEGSKNAVLPILAASLLNGRESIIKNCPRLRDVDVMIGILRRIGCSVKVEGDVIIVDSAGLCETSIPVELAAEMRSSIIFMGPMLARCGCVTISYPGGCITFRAPAQRQPDTGAVPMETGRLYGCNWAWTKVQC
ncbi:MAG: UDP-N-acetylglucosamine 1-carboxyvinyltransferase [Bacillota bacterium]|jgi:UDP-N-acetylglucosamine 1-carboxyvinyltransferase|nr:UDP-N-acetylglucosamine 1-carboxyvinyltransferase [Bacillota bacterium]